MSIRRRSCLALCALALVLAACKPSTPSMSPLPAHTTVVALGDSLTAGVGAAPKQDWPHLIAQRTGWNVINAGVSGNTSAQGLQRLPDLLRTHQPQLVIIGLGGNDFLRRHPSSVTQDNLAEIINLVQAYNAQAVLIAIPQPSLLAAAGATPRDHPLYAELGKRFKVPVFEKLWGPILGDETLRSDTVHANAQGYAQFAKAFYQRLRSSGLIAQ